MREFELEPGEHLVKEVRKHWLLFFADLVPFAILVIVPLAIPNALRSAVALERFADYFNYSTPLARVVLASWWLLVWGAAFNSFTKYFLNAWILTNQRVVEIKQFSFFDREVSSLFLNRIEDVTTDTSGVVDSLLDIGDINAQTAGTVDRFTMRGIPHPAQLRDIMLRYQSLHGLPVETAAGRPSGTPDTGDAKMGK